MKAPDYRVVIELVNVGEGDATGLAQEIHDEHGDEFDAANDEFRVSVKRVEGSNSFDTGWTPEG